MYEVFKINLCRFHKTGDITVSAHWAYINNTHNTDNINIEEGSAVIVINTDHKNNSANIFVPSVTDVKLSEICTVDIHDIPIKKSEGISSRIRETENWFVAFVERSDQRGRNHT